jgi:TonB family protein
MSEHTAAASAKAVASDAMRPPELRFLLPESKTDMKALFGGAGSLYIVFFILTALVVWMRPERQILAVLPDFEPQDIVYLEVAGPGGGGGGGGNKSPEPPKTAPVPKVKPPEPDPIPVPVEEPKPVPEPEPVAAEIPAITPTQDLAAVAPTLNAAPPSLGPGTGGGAGTGRGDGIGSGSGDGLGEGRGGGTGGGVYRLGSGITNPTLVSSAKPQYTSEAMLRRIQGEVHLDCVVTKTGNVGNCDVVKSLDANNFGLDSEAMKAARKFVFRPGLLKGEPVDVLVRIQIAFNMR